MSYQIVRDGILIGVAELVSPIPADREVVYELGSREPVQGRPVTPMVSVHRMVLNVADVGTLRRQDTPIDLVGLEDTYRGAWIREWRSAWSTEGADTVPAVTIIEEAKLVYTERETITHDTWWLDGDTLYQGHSRSYQHQVLVVGEDLVIENSSGTEIKVPVRVVAELISPLTDRLARLWDESGPGRKKH